LYYEFQHCSLVKIHSSEDVERVWS
jgi:hypothetical protein